MAIDPIPQVGISRIIGLLKVLDDAGGRYDIFRLAREINYEFGEILKVVKAAEMLELVVTPAADAVLTARGKEVLKAKVNARKKLLREQIKQLPLFRTVVEALLRSENHRAEEGAFIRYVTPPRQSASSRLVVVPCDWPAGAPNAAVRHSQTEPTARACSPPGT